MTPRTTSLLVLGIALALAVVLAAAGVVRLVRLGLGLKRRIAAYKGLPLQPVIDVAQRKIFRATQRAAGLPVLADRAKAAWAAIVRARATIGAIITSPSALWRLGELVVTGK